MAPQQFCHFRWMLDSYSNGRLTCGIHLVVFFVEQSCSASLEKFEVGRTRSPCPVGEFPQPRESFIKGIRCRISLNVIDAPRSRGARSSKLPPAIFHVKTSTFAGSFVSPVTTHTQWAPRSGARHQNLDGNDGEDDDYTRPRIQWTPNSDIN